MVSPVPVCRFCGESFRPHPRVGARQIACSSSSCQAARKRDSQARWLAAHPDYFHGQYPKKRAWHKAHPGYLAAYRRDHPAAAERHREQERARRRRKALDRAVDIQDELTIQTILFPQVTAGAPGVDIQDEIPVHRSILVGLIERWRAGEGRVDIQDRIDSAVLECYKIGRRLQHRRTAP